MSIQSQRILIITVCRAQTWSATSGDGGFARSRNAAISRQRKSRRRAEMLQE